MLGHFPRTALDNSQKQGCGGAVGVNLDDEAKACGLLRFAYQD